jgi:hypothetical protein
MATSILSAITYARQLSQTDSNGLSDSLGLAFANDATNDFIRELTERNVNAGNLTFSPVSVLTAGATQFSWPANLYSLKTLEVNYLDNNQQNYLQPQNVEIANAQGSPFDWLRVNQPTNAPLFANYGNTWELFPTPVTNANAKFVYFTLPTEYPDVGTAVAYPATLDYRLLGAKIASLYKLSLDEFVSSQTFDKEYEKRLNKIINILAPTSQQPISAEPLHISGFQF